MRSKRKLLPNGLPKGRRLLKPAEYQQVFKQQKKIYYRGVVIYYCENQCAYSRLGIAVAKRHFKKAVTRNRIKRKVRESFRLSQQTSIAHKDIANKDIVVVATSKLREENKCQITSALNELWQKLAALS